MKNIKFRYFKDKKFFIDLLAGGDAASFKKNSQHYFDFRDPGLKRKEFNVLRNKRLKDILKKRGTKCQLNFVPRCNNRKLVLDHMIPLSTNELNKYLRHMKVSKGKKIPAESYGANHSDNFLLACEECNNFKKHRFIEKNNNKYEIVRWKIKK